MVHPGSCFCGAVTFRLEDEPMFVNCCHCTDCRRQMGSAFAINGVIEAANVTVLSGAPRPVPLKTDSGGPHDLCRCPACGTPLWSDYGVPGIRIVKLATLDDADAFPPQAHIYVRSKLPWVVLPADVPAYPAYYDMKTVWPAAMLERRFRTTGGL